MDQATFSTFLGAFMIDVAVLAGVPLAAATLCGLVVSFFQAITQVQDQTLSQTIKITAIVVILIVFGAALTSPLLTSTRMVFDSFADLAR